MPYDTSHQDLPTARGWVEAVIFDLDGVITDTAEVHARAWEEMFNDFLKARAAKRGEAFRPFDTRDDYLRYVDGKPRYDGVRSFLDSRGIHLDEGTPDDPPARETICGLGNRKNALYNRLIASGGVRPYPEAVAFLRRLKADGVKTAIVSSSKNCKTVIEAARIDHLFDVRVDGVVSAKRGLQGKPAPDIFLEAAQDLQVAPDRGVVFEDALSGVEAGRRGAFGCVIGVDRTGENPDLQAHGADLVVPDLAGIDIGRLPRRRRTTRLPAALAHTERIAGWLAAGQPAFFLDYDGTLTPIVARPEQAVLSTAMRRTLAALARHGIVAIVSGRGLEDVRQRVGLDNLVYAGSHGFEIYGPGRERLRSEKGTAALPALADAEQKLRERLADIEGAQVERKRFSIAVHYRNVASAQTETVARIVDEVRQGENGLRKGYGKKVFELQPDVEWDKGRAVLWLMDRLGLDPAAVRPIYIGDDVTDEDAFRALQGRGCGIVVHGGEGRSTFADFGLGTPEDVRAFLAELADAAKGGA
jgi:trehalose-phosphatase